MKPQSLISLAFCSIVLFGCGSNVSSSSSVSSSFEYAKDDSSASGESIVFPEAPVFVDYESESEISLYGYKNVNGKISINKNKEFVTHGEASMKVEAYGNPYVALSETVNLEYWSGSGNIPSDLSGKQHIKLDIFNASGKAISGLFFGIFDFDPSWDYITTPGMTLPDGEWFHFDFEIPQDTAFTPSSMRFFKFAFPNLTLEDPSPYTLYVDNLTIE